MKKAIRIHISGYIFSIDEDAYSILKQWLDNVSVQYLKEEDGEEIINDIEMRVAELFKDKVGNDGAVSLIEVNSIIKTMGQPEEFEEENSIINKTPTTSENRNSKKTFSSNKKTRKEKRLFRDDENSVIAGVCGGIGNYLGIDPVLIRLAFILAVFVGGFGTVIYIILWAITPKALTVSQKLEMMGEPVNISNIEKAIKEEFEYFKEKFSHKKRRYHRRRR